MRRPSMLIETNRLRSARVTLKDGSLKADVFFCVSLPRGSHAEQAALRSDEEAAVQRRRVVLGTGHGRRGQAAPWIPA